MKKFFLSAGLIITAVSFTATTQTNAASFTVIKKGDGQPIPASSVPAPVRTSFNAQYPSATNVQWEKEKEHGQVVYQADFKMNGKRWRVVYTADGGLINAGPR